MQIKDMRFDPLVRVPNLLLQKFPAPSFTVTTRVRFEPDLPGERSGLVVMGRDCGHLAMVKTDAGLKLAMYTGTYFQGYDKTEEIESVALDRESCILRVQVDGDAPARFITALMETPSSPWAHRSELLPAPGSDPRSVSSASIQTSRTAAAMPISTGSDLNDLPVNRLRGTAWKWLKSFSGTTT